MTGIANFSCGYLAQNVSISLYTSLKELEKSRTQKMG